MPQLCSPSPLFKTIDLSGSPHRPEPYAEAPFQVPRGTFDHHCNQRTLPSVAQLCKGVLPSYDSTSTLSPSLQALERRINPAPPPRSLSCFNRLTAVADFWASDQTPQPIRVRPLEKLRERDPDTCPYQPSLSRRRYVPRLPFQEQPGFKHYSDVEEFPCSRKDSVTLDHDKTYVEPNNQSSSGIEVLVVPHPDGSALEKQQDDWLEYVVKLEKEDEQQDEDDEEGRGQSIYQCRYEDDRGQLCNYRGLKQMVKRHVNSVHLKKRPWACEFCPKRFPQVTKVFHCNSYEM
ncbi:hypothetical protein BYT27DRAFT_7335712 [Phlegmacium glaucopus]|nr:hypothetical protein BYT27DRAFT_7335712 [Phlegmacium glaucopus]